MASSADSRVVRALRRLADWVYDYPRLFFYPQLILFVLSILYTVEHLEFSSSRLDLVGADKEYHRNLIAYKREFPTQDVLAAVVESDDLEKNRQFVERLGARLLAETNLFTDVIFNNEVKFLGNKALLFFPETALQELRQTLADYRPFIERFAVATNLQSLFQLVNRQFRTAQREASAENQAMVKALPALRRIIEQGSASLERPGNPPSPGLAALLGAGDEAEKKVYLTFAQGRIFLVMCKARKEAQNPAAVVRLRHFVEQTQAEVPGVNAAITGEPVLEFDEMRQAQHDTTVASVVSLVLVALIFIYGYQESGRPVKATICLVVGLAYTLAFASATIGHLNILTITFLPMLIGLAIDFGVHLVTRYEEELRRGRSEREAIGKAIVYTGQGIFTGCFTTAGAFLAMGITRFRGIQEMGVICGGGLLICLIPMMTLLPVLILRGRQNVLDHTYPHAVEKRARIERLWLERPATVIGLSLALSGFAWLEARKVGFDYNLLNLQSRGLSAVAFEQKLLKSAEKSLLYCAVITGSLKEALALEAIVTNLPAVSSADTMARYLTEDQTRKLKVIDRIKDEVAPIGFAAPDRRPVDLLELDRTLWALQGYLGLALDEVSQEQDPALRAELKALRDSTGVLRKTMLAEPREAGAVRLGAFQQALFDNIRGTFDAIKSQDTRERMRVEDLPDALRHRFVSKSGALHLVQVYPKKDVWQRENQAEFVHQLRQALDPQHTGKPIITGTPVQLLEYTSLLKNSYQEAAWYSLGAIAILVFIHFRSLACVVLSLLPVGVGTLWMVGFMGWHGLSFNPANIMTLPLVIGIGVTSGIHILNRFAEERTPSILAKSTGKAVFVSALTTVVGFGSLILAKHQGIASLGYVMAVGTATCMIAALTLLPAILNELLRHGWSLSGKRPSGETGGSTLGQEEPR